MGLPSGKKQLALAGLDNLGSDDTGITLEGTAGKLVEMAGFLVSEAQKNLDKSGSNAFGELESSIKARDIQIDGTSMSVDIEILDRYDFLNSGVKGTESGQGKYQFKNNRPSKKMATSVLKWIRKRGSRAVKYKPTSKTENKDQSINKLRQADDYKALAYATATNIKKHGIKGTKFFDKAVKATEKKIKKELSAGFKIDIINSLK